MRRVSQSLHFWFLRPQTLPGQLKAMVAKRTFLAAVLLLGPTAVTAQSRIFWADEGRHQVFWIRSDGTQEETFTEISAPQQVLVDEVFGYLYWLTAHYGHGQYGTLFRSRLDHPDNPLRIREIGYSEGGFALDPTTGKLYIAQPGVAPGPGDFSIVRMNTDGSNYEVWLPGVAPRIGGMDIDVSEGALFLTDGYLERVDLRTGTFQDLLVGVNSTGGVALDREERKIYWIGDGGLYRTNYDGSNVELFWASSSGGTKDIGFDDVRREVYWGHVDGSGTSWVRHAPANGVLPVENPASFTTASPVGRFDLFADPGAAQLAAPSDGSAGLSTSLTLNWMPVVGSARYDVQVSAGADFSAIVFKENTPSTSATFVAPVAQRTFYWRVQSNACGIAPHWSTARSFTVGANGPLAANLQDPGPDEVTGPEVTFTWDGAPDATTFTLQIARRSDFAPKDVKLENLVEKTATVTGLAAGEQYYWRVAGWDDAGHYTFTKPRSFMVAATVAAPVLEAPADGEEGVPVDPQLKWSDLDGATTYIVQIAQDESFTDVVIADTVESPSFTVLNPLAHLKTYHWRVKGRNQSGAGPWSAAWRFKTTARTLTAVGLTSPPDGATEVSVYPELSWEELDGAESYIVQLATVADFSQLIVSDTVESNTLEVSALQPYDTDFYWRVRGVNQAGYGPWSNTWMFTTAVGTAAEPDVELADELGGVYPNPASHRLRVSFSTAQNGPVRIEAFDVYGRRVSTFVDGLLEAGKHEAAASIDELASGLYFIRLTSRETVREAAFAVVR